LLGAFVRFFVRRFSRISFTFRRAKADQRDHRQLAALSGAGFIGRRH
jgi:hypothetical protein